MKKIILIILGAIVSGTILTGIIFIKINKALESNEERVITVFQVGVYKNEVNALSVAKKYGGIIHQEDDYYRVYIAAYQNEEIINKMKNYYNENGISYYLRKLEIDEEYLTTINKYEKLLQNSSDDSIYKNLNNLLITKLEDYLWYL